MKNITESTDLDCKLEYWISDIAICSLVFLIFLYILFALVYHEKRVKKPCQIRFLQLPIEKRYSVLSKYTCISIAVAFLVQYASLVSGWSVEDIAILSGSNQTAAETVCIVAFRISILAFTVGNGLVYLFLWLRQRVIYVHPSLKVHNNKYVIVFSFAVLIAWILFWISLIIVLFIKVQLHFNRNFGCIVDKDSIKPYSRMVYTWTAVSILMQISLLSLYIYPILKQARWRGQQNSPNLMKRVKKAIVFASICFGTDIAPYIIGILFATKCVVSSLTWVYSINLLINHLITIGGFNHWKKLLWPWNIKCCIVARAESGFDETISKASFSASQSQSKVTAIT